MFRAVRWVRSEHLMLRSPWFYLLMCVAWYSGCNSMHSLLNDNKQQPFRNNWREEICHRHHRSACQVCKWKRVMGTSDKAYSSRTWARISFKLSHSLSTAQKQSGNELSYFIHCSWRRNDLMGGKRLRETCPSLRLLWILSFVFIIAWFS